ncbi:MAG: phage tail protein [Oscillospiraceae bacterium]|jgi:hypothetical protein|nr:phage tail protein [Oscillospiraceae bacterium]
MYTVTITDGEEKYVINEVNAHSYQRISGAKVTEQLNVPASFEFVIYPQNTGYYRITERRTKVCVRKGTETVFDGYVYKINEIMTNNGIVCKKCVCESIFGYFYDSVQSFKEFRGVSMSRVLGHILDVHNSSAEDYKRFQLGNTDVILTPAAPPENPENESNPDFTINYENTRETLGNLVNEFGGEFFIRTENGINYLDYLLNFGKYIENVKIKLSHNMKNIDVFFDSSGIVTRLYPYGEKLKTTDSEGNEETTDYRLDIRSVNGGLPYIDDLAAQEKYGIICGIEIWDDADTARELISKAREFLAANSKPADSYKITALDLSVIGLDLDTFRLANYYQIINGILGITEDKELYLRVLKKTYDLNSPQNSTLEFGKIRPKESEISKETYDFWKKSGSLLLNHASYIDRYIQKTVNSRTKNFTTGSQVDSKISSGLSDLDLSGKSADNTTVNSTNLSEILSGLDRRIEALGG